MRAEDSSFERGVSGTYPDLRRHVTAWGIWYAATIDLDRFEPRRVRIFVPFSSPITGIPRGARWGNGLPLPLHAAAEPDVLVDGPKSLPHRYSYGLLGRIRLCIWYPADPPAARWAPSDGLLELLGFTRTHLLREAFYLEDMRTQGRATWLGPEAPHRPLVGARAA